MDTFISVITSRITNSAINSLSSLSGRLASQSIYELDFSSTGANDFIEVISGDTYRIWSIYTNKAGDIVLDSCGSQTSTNQDRLKSFFSTHSGSSASYRILSTTEMKLDDTQSWTVEKLDGPWFGMGIGTMSAVLLLAVSYTIDNNRLKRVCFRPSEGRAWIDYWNGWDNWDKGASTLGIPNSPTMCCVPAVKDGKFIFHVRATKLGKAEELAAALKKIGSIP